LRVGLRAGYINGVAARGQRGGGGQRAIAEKLVEDGCGGGGRIARGELAPQPGGLRVAGGIRQPRGGAPSGGGPQVVVNQRKFSGVERQRGHQLMAARGVRQIRKWRSVIVSYLPVINQRSRSRPINAIGRNNHVEPRVAVGLAA